MSSFFSEPVSEVKEFQESVGAVRRGGDQGERSSPHLSLHAHPRFLSLVTMGWGVAKLAWGSAKFWGMRPGYVFFCHVVLFDGWRAISKTGNTGKVEVKQDSMQRLASARIFRPSFRDNKLKPLVFYDWKRAFWSCCRENWVYKFGHGVSPSFGKATLGEH